MLPDLALLHHAPTPSDVDNLRQLPSLPPSAHPRRLCQDAPRGSEHCPEMSPIQPSMVRELHCARDVAEACRNRLRASVMAFGKLEFETSWQRCTGFVVATTNQPAVFAQYRAEKRRAHQA